MWICIIYDIGIFQCYFALESRSGPAPALVPALVPVPASPFRRKKTDGEQGASDRAKKMPRGSLNRKFTQSAFKKANAEAAAAVAAAAEATATAASVAVAFASVAARLAE